ncbi:MAG: hypothetical protein KDD62_02570, partial [Bdellovibrionales bacterium]|nr:hypothetical protein [Bdellovibrionales bacterium]
MKIAKISLQGLLIVMICSSSAFAAAGKEYDYTRKIGKVNCVFDAESQKWQLAKKLKDNTYKLKKKPKKSLKNFKQKNKKFKKENRTCGKQSDPRVATFANIPGAHQIIPVVAGSTAVSGTPPAYTAITDSSALTTYWREVDGNNVVAALAGDSPTVNQCEEFYGGDADGESGGLNACNANLDALRALVKPLEGGIAACYLQNVTSESNLAAGGISLDESSAFPGGNIQNLYASPSGAVDRIVKMQVINAGGDDDGSDIYVKVHSQDSNTAANLSYKVDLWFCSRGQSSGTPYGLDHIQVGTDNSYLATALNTRDGSIYRSLAGSITSEGGQYIFDPSQPTEAVVTFLLSEGGGSFGYQISTVG